MERDSSEPTLGVEEGGLQSAEALLWARHFMYTQLYFHPVRRIYDIHLKEFLQAWLPSGKFSTSPEEHLRMTDNEVLSGMAESSADSEARGHDSARRIIRREHFKVLYKRNPTDQQRNKQSARAVFEAAEEHFGPGTVRIDEPSVERAMPEIIAVCSHHREMHKYGKGHFILPAKCLIEQSNKNLQTQAGLRVSTNKN